MKKYFLIKSKPDDIGCCNQMVIYEDEKVFKKKYVYYYEEITKEDYEILKKYLGDFYDYYNKTDFEYFQ